MAAKHSGQPKLNASFNYIWYAPFSDLRICPDMPRVYSGMLSHASGGTVSHACGEVHKTAANANADRAPRSRKSARKARQEKAKAARQRAALVATTEGRSEKQAPSLKRQASSAAHSQYICMCQYAMPREGSPNLGGARKFRGHKIRPPVGWYRGPLSRDFKCAS